jgi:hypothetical protein
LNNLSTPAEQYYACPHCLIKLDVISTQPQKEEKKKEKPPVKPPEKKEKGSRCLIILDTWQVVIKMFLSRKNA